LTLIGASFFGACVDPKLAEEQVARLNERIDKLEVVEEEIVVKANSMNELELVATAMEKRQTFRLQNIAEREKLAQKKVMQLEAELLEKQQKLKLIEEKAQNYPKTLAEQEKALDARIEKLLKELEQVISLKPRPGEEKVVLLERMVETIKALSAENETLRQQLKK
jgi:hypothetical protein